MNNTQKIALGSDHAGFEFKEKIKHSLQEKGYQILDCGTFSADSVDYPTFAYKVAKLVSEGKYERGIIVDGAGIGSAMVANKVPGVRAALCYDVSTARNSREHNAANVLTLGAGLIGINLAMQIVEVWLATDCTEDRHLRRVKLIEDIEKGKMTVSVDINNGEDKFQDFSDEDLKRIAAKIATMFQQTGAGPTFSPTVCGEEECTSCGQCADKIPDTVQKLIDIGATRVSHAPGGSGIPKEIAKYIDHTILKPETTRDDIYKLCLEAVEFKFASVCINPTWVKLSHDLTKNSAVKVCTVVGFPLGANLPEIKGMETRRAIREGAKEIDMVINIGALKSGDDPLVLRDIRTVVEACVDGSAICKVIIETAVLTDEEKIRACELSKKARAHYVKTSTGFASGGATAHDVALMAKVVRGTAMGVKAAGGIKSYEDAKKMIEAGATRIGASAGIKIIQEAKNISDS